MKRECARAMLQSVVVISCEPRRWHGSTVDRGRGRLWRCTLYFWLLLLVLVLVCFACFFAFVGACGAPAPGSGSGERPAPRRQRLTIASRVASSTQKLAHARPYRVVHSIQQHNQQPPHARALPHGPPAIFPCAARLAAALAVACGLPEGPGAGATLSDAARGRGHVC